MHSNRSLRAWGSLCGLLFVGLFVAGTVVLFSGVNGQSDSQVKYAAYYADSGHRDKANIGWILAGLALFFLIWFVAALREHAQDWFDGEGMLAYVILIGGTAYVAVDMAAIGLVAGVKTMSDDTYHHQVYSGVIHGANDASYIMHVTGTAGLAAMIFAFSIVILGSRMLPRWVAWFGFVAGVAALASVVFFTQIIWLAWIAVTSLVLFVHSRTADGRHTESRPAAT